MGQNVKPERISEIAVILAKGFLRYRKSNRIRLPEPPQNGLAFVAEPSRYVTGVNAERTDEN